MPRRSGTTISSGAASPPPEGQQPSGRLADLIKEEFGSTEDMLAKLKDEAVNHFSNGWAWLVLNRGKLEITSLHDADTPVVHDGMQPLLTLDVWEHAYYIDYRNERPKFAEKRARQHRQLGVRRPESRRRGHRPGRSGGGREGAGGGLGLQPVAGAEDPVDDPRQMKKKPRVAARLTADADVGRRVEAPAEALDQIDDRVEVGDRPPRLAAASTPSRRRRRGR